MQGPELKELLSVNLKRIRKNRGLSQFALGEKADISEDTIKSIELTRQWPSDKTLARIAQALDIDVFTLFLPNSNTVRFSSEKSKEIKKLIAENLKDYVEEVISSM